MKEGPTKQQQCALHLLDLCRAYPRDLAQPQAMALLEIYRARGAEARLEAEKAAQAAAMRAAAMRATTALAAHAAQTGRLAAARRKLIEIIARRVAA
jgi:hypothetical protein